jgi:hypothetical protein
MSLSCMNLSIFCCNASFRFWLNRNSIDPTITEQTLHLLKTILEQNYSQHNSHFYKPKKGITMGSPYPAH